MTDEQAKARGRMTNDQLIQGLNEEIIELVREIDRLCRRSILLRETKEALEQVVADTRRSGNDVTARPTAADLMESLRPEEVGPRVRSARVVGQDTVVDQPVSAPDWAMKLKGSAPMPAVATRKPVPRRSYRSGPSPNVDRVAEYLEENGPSNCIAIAQGLNLDYQTVYSALTGRFWERFQKVNGVDGKAWALRPAEVSAEKGATHG